MREETTVFRVEKHDGKYTLFEAQRVAKRGSWWHLRKKDGGIVKVNGGGGWRETMGEAWARAMRGMLYRVARTESKPYAQWKNAQDEAIGLFRDAMEDCFDTGKLLGSIEQRERMKRERPHEA